jgi:hypothetical protein
MNDRMKTDYPSNQLSYHELIASKQKIVTLSISPNHLRKYPSSPVAATMDPDPASYPKPMEEIEKLIQRGDLFVYTTELKRIKNGLDIMHERHGEILKEKEDKIWAVQNHLLTERAETDRLRKEVNSVNATIGQQLNTIHELRQSNLGNYR